MKTLAHGFECGDRRFLVVGMVWGAPKTFSVVFICKYESKGIMTERSTTYCVGTDS